ncbi:MAG: serine/threonine-protein kinase [Streptosporangiaceae bacterium]
MIGHAPAPFSPGYPLLPGYQVTEHLARGQTLDVYAAWSERRDCLCVVKTPRPDRLADRAGRRRLLHEGRLLCELGHPHLVRGYETHGGPPPAVVMETLAGQTLGHLIATRRQGLAVGDLAELGLQLCSVVRYLHRSGTLHLDLKPSNVVAEAGRARLFDLSHARAPGPCPAGFGTREYMPPEQLTGGTVSGASDVFGLGGVLHRAATRRRPFAVSERDDPYRRPRFAALRRRALPPALVRLIEACLEPSPADRPATADIAHTLGRLAGLPSWATRQRSRNACLS